MIFFPNYFFLKSFLNRMGRDIAYDSWSCDIICAASSPDLYRINLEQVCLIHKLCALLIKCLTSCTAPLSGIFFLDFSAYSLFLWWDIDYVKEWSSTFKIWLHLWQGRFLASLSTQSPALNVVSRRLVKRHFPWALFHAVQLLAVFMYIVCWSIQQNPWISRWWWWGWCCWMLWYED